MDKSDLTHHRCYNQLNARAVSTTPMCFYSFLLLELLCCKLSCYGFKRPSSKNRCCSLTHNQFRLYRPTRCNKVAPRRDCKNGLNIGASRSPANSTETNTVVVCCPLFVWTDPRALHSGRHRFKYARAGRCARTRGCFSSADGVSVTQAKERLPHEPSKTPANYGKLEERELFDRLDCFICAGQLTNDFFFSFYFYKSVQSSRVT